MMVCPCCSQSTGRIDPIWLGPYLRLAGYTARVYDLLSRNFGKIVAGERIVDHLYGADADGGPIGARENLSVWMSRLRAQIAPFGLAVDAVRADTSDGWGYRLRWTEEVPEIERRVAA